eukprot:30942-Pelagococcus_subviridis.AAC.23
MIDGGRVTTSNSSGTTRTAPRSRTARPASCASTFPCRPRLNPSRTRCVSFRPTAAPRSTVASTVAIRCPPETDPSFARTARRRSITPPPRGRTRCRSRSRSLRPRPETPSRTSPARRSPPSTAGRSAGRSKKSSARRSTQPRGRASLAAVRIPRTAPPRRLIFRSRCTLTPYRAGPR